MKTVLFLGGALPSAPFPRPPGSLTPRCRLSTSEATGDQPAGADGADRLGDLGGETGNVLFRGLDILAEAVQDVTETQKIAAE